MKKEVFLQIFLFSVFFAIGTAAIGIALLSDELLRYHQGKALLEKSRLFIERIEQINADYDALLQQLRDDPNAVERLAPATLGVERTDDNAAYPKARMEQLAAARKALMEKAVKENTTLEEENWITRCGKKPARITLFFCGSALIIIALTFFGPSTGKTSLADDARI